MDYFMIITLLQHIKDITFAMFTVTFKTMIKRKNGFLGERALILPRSIIHIMESNPLTNALHITDIGYYPRAKYHFRKREVPIPQYVLIYCVEGKGWFRVNNEHYKIKSNQCFVLPANIAHSYGTDDKEPWTIYWIHFKGELAKHYASQLLIPIDIKSTIYSRINGRLNLFEEIYHTLEMGYSKENLSYTSSALHHFLGTICYLKEYRNAIVNDASNDLVDTAIHFMKENIGKKLSTLEIAAYTGYSVSHFSTIFNNRTGHSPINYFNLLKIQHACYLIDCTDIKINQVCHKIGIEDCYYFSRLFSKIMGMSPREYRKQKKG